MSIFYNDFTVPLVGTGLNVKLGWNVIGYVPDNGLIYLSQFDGTY